MRLMRPAGCSRGDKVYGRPVDVALMDDDSLLVSDDYGGVLYRIAP